MTTHPATIHALPVDAAGDHFPSEWCACHPILAADMAEPGRVVYCHRHNAPREVSTDARTTASVLVSMVPRVLPGLR
jgi:hypothetical protein